MVECSIGHIDGAIRRRALSGYTFAEINVPMENYNDSPKFTLTIDKHTVEYKIVGSEVFMQAGSKTIVKISAIKADQEKWLEVVPSSVEEADIKDLLKGLEIEDGPSLQVSNLLNLFLTKGQYALMLANMTPKNAFIDFEKQKVVYYSELYKQKAQVIQVPFRRIYSRVPMAGYFGWEETASGYFPNDAQTIIPFGQFNNMDKTTIDNLVTNCNDIAKMFSDLQVFTWPEELELGTTVLSPLTMDKKVIVAVEEQWDSQTPLNAYYCI